VLGSTIALVIISLGLEKPASPAAGELSPGAPGDDAYSRSIRLVESALAGRPGDARLLGLLADVHFRRGKFREAIAAFEEASRRDPKAVEPLFGLAEAWLRLEEHDRALNAYRTVLAALPPGRGARARRGMAEVHFRKDRYREAIEEVRAAIREGDESPDVRYELARALDAEVRAIGTSGQARGEAASLEAEAMDALSRAVERDPRHHQALYLLATIHRRRGEADAARKRLEDYRKWKPPNTPLAGDAYERSEVLFEARTAVRLARVLFESGDAEGALARVGVALRIQPDLVEALAYEGWIHLRLGNHGEAIRSYEKALAREPDHAESLWNLGKIHLATRDVDRAAPLLLRATELRGAFPEGWELLSRLASEGVVYPERAEEFARNALRLRPAPPNYARLAELLFARGSAADSMKVLDEGLRRYPEDPHLRAAMDALQRATGRRRE
jgi:tetratricopeptide (TPR) repeat protein